MQIFKFVFFLKNKKKNTHTHTHVIVFQVSTNILINLFLKSLYNIKIIKIEHYIYIIFSNILLFYNKLGFFYYHPTGLYSRNVHTFFIIEIMTNISNHLRLAVPIVTLTAHKLEHCIQEYDVIFLFRKWLKYKAAKVATKFSKVCHSICNKFRKGWWVYHIIPPARLLGVQISLPSSAYKPRLGHSYPNRIWRDHCRKKQDPLLRNIIYMYIYIDRRNKNISKCGSTSDNFVMSVPAYIGCFKSLKP